jgi:uncharacterized membrane protein YhaH (DUF805 family)
MSKYGQVGWDVGIVGRWFRLVMGILIVLLVLFDFLGGSHTHSLRTNVLTGLFFVGFLLAYLVAYLLIVERVKDKSPWIPTVIFVFPAMYFSVINEMVVPFELSFGYLIGMPWVNHPMTLAMLLYIGVSFPIQFFTKYGGCEVIAIQNLLYKKRCSSYCVPLLPLDMAEKSIVDALARKAARHAKA